MRGLEACVGCWAVLFPNACRTRESYCQGHREKREAARTRDKAQGMVDFPRCLPTRDHWVIGVSHHSRSSMHSLPTMSPPIRGRSGDKRIFLESLGGKGIQGQISWKSPMLGKKTTLWSRALAAVRTTGDWTVARAALPGGGRSCPAAGFPSSPRRALSARTPAFCILCLALAAPHTLARAVPV